MGCFVQLLPRVFRGPKRCFRIIGFRTAVLHFFWVVDVHYRSLFIITCAGRAYLDEVVRVRAGTVLGQVPLADQRRTLRLFLQMASLKTAGFEGSLIIFDKSFRPIAAVGTQGVATSLTSGICEDFAERIRTQRKAVLSWKTCPRNTCLQTGSLMSKFLGECGAALLARSCDRAIGREAACGSFSRSDVSI